MNNQEDNLMTLLVQEKPSTDPHAYTAEFPAGRGTLNFHSYMTILNGVRQRVTELDKGSGSVLSAVNTMSGECDVLHVYRGASAVCLRIFLPDYPERKISERTVALTLKTIDVIKEMVHLNPF